MKSKKITIRNAGIPDNSGDMDSLPVASKHFNDLHEDVSVIETDLGVLSQQTSNSIEFLTNPKVGKIMSFERELTDAEATTMFTTPVVLIPSPGPGKFIEIIDEPVFVTKFGTAAFTGGGAITIRSNTITITATLSAANSLLATADRVAFVGLLDTANGIQLVIDGPITITNATGNFVKGTSTSKLTVRFLYRIHEV